MRFASLVFLTIGLAPSLAVAQTSYPMITHTYPVAVQRGKTTEVTVDGQQNFLGAYQVLVDGDKVTAEVVPTEPPKPQPGQKPLVRSVKLKFTPAEDALPGVREFRIVTASGVSSIGQIVVVDDSVVMESANNNTPANATPVTMPGVGCGKIEALEDVDYFKFKVDAGKMVTFEVRGARLQDKIHDLQKHLDPMITLYDVEGKELASSDDFFFADPMFSYRFEQGGEYVVQIRDSKYDGDQRWMYALTVTDKPYVSHVFPLAVAPGKATEVDLIGSAKELQPRGKLSVPANAAPGIFLAPVEIGVQRTNPVASYVTPLPLLTEQEPNNSPEEATPITLPACLNGRIGVKRDLDHYKFTAKKGQALRFEVKARRFGTELVSGLDASVEILDAKGAVVASGDDISPAIKDAALVFTAPGDGDYYLRVRDLFSKGGDHFVYAVEAEPVAPDFTLRCDSDKAMIGPGSSAAWYVHVTRLNGFTGPVNVEVRDLPPGVTANRLVIPASMTQGLLVLTAAADAPRAAANVQVLGTATLKDSEDKEQQVTKPAAPNQEIYIPGGGRGRFDVSMHTVAVTEPSDIEGIEVTPKTINLKPGEEVKITVKIKRRQDFDGNVGLDVKLRHLNQVYGDPLPPGVTMEDGKSKTLLGKGNEGHIILKAAPNAAPIENVPISVLAQVSINFVVKISHSSEPILLSVAGAAK